MCNELSLCHTIWKCKQPIYEFRRNRIYTALPEG